MTLFDCFAAMQRWRQRFRTCMEFQFLRLQVMKFWNWEIGSFLMVSRQVGCCVQQNRWIQKNSGWSDLGWMGHRTQRWGWIGIRCVWCSHPKLLVGRIEGSGKMKKYAAAMDFEHFQWGLQKLIWSLEPLSSWATLPRHIGIAPCKGRCCAHGAIWAVCCFKQGSTPIRNGFMSFRQRQSTPHCTKISQSSVQLFWLG